MTPPTVSRLVVLSVVGALVLAACGPATESPSPSATPAPTPSAVPASPASPTGAPQGDAVYDAIEDQVVCTRYEGDRTAGWLGRNFTEDGRRLAGLDDEHERITIVPAAPLGRLLVYRRPPAQGPSGT